MVVRDSGNPPTGCPSRSGREAVCSRFRVSIPAHADAPHAHTTSPVNVRLICVPLSFCALSTTVFTHAVWEVQHVDEIGYLANRTAPLTGVRGLFIDVGTHIGW